MADADAWERARRMALKAQVVARRAMIVDAVLTGQAAGLTIGELVDLVSETEESLVFTDADELARTFLAHGLT